jgi:hypothetical protein
MFSGYNTCKGQMRGYFFHLQCLVQNINQFSVSVNIEVSEYVHSMKCKEEDKT